MKKIRNTIIVIILLLLLIAGFILIIMFLPESHIEYDRVRELVEQYEKELSQMCTKRKRAEWEYTVDLGNSEKKQIYLNTIEAYDKFVKKYWKNYFKTFEFTKIKDSALKRQIKLLSVIGDAALDGEELQKLNIAKNEMLRIYATSKICPYIDQNCNLSKNGMSVSSINNAFAKTPEYDNLLYMWSSWAKLVGKQLKQQFKTYVSLSNRAALENGYSDKGALWIADYDVPSFPDLVIKLWQQIKPLYDELHKYAGKKLLEQFQDKFDMSDGLIPVHLFGSLGAQDWIQIYPILKPFSNVEKISLNKELKSQNYTVLKLFEVANDFYKSMSLLSNEIAYNTSAGAVIENDKNGKIVKCHPHAFDFCDGKNYRIRMCAEVDVGNFAKIHHELGHIQYYLQYASQTITFRQGANPAFHEAVGDAFKLASLTTNNVKRLKLVSDDYQKSYESSINSLMELALLKVASMPYFLALDAWRWDVFSGKIPENKWNTEWWNYRKLYQKVKPPIKRFELDDFDPTIVTEIVSDISCISYFIQYILEFQMFKSLCTAGGKYHLSDKNVFLHDCEFYGSKQAGIKMANGLSLGASKHWSIALEAITGSKNLDAEPLLEYFKPLYEYLKEQNSKST